MQSSLLWSTNTAMSCYTIQQEQIVLTTTGTTQTNKHVMMHTSCNDTNSHDQSVSHRQFKEKRLNATAYNDILEQCFSNQEKSFRDNLNLLETQTIIQYYSFIINKLYVCVCMYSISMLQCYIIYLYILIQCFYYLIFIYYIIMLFIIIIIYFLCII